MAVLGLAEWASSRVQPPESATAAVERPKNVIIIPQSPEQLPAPVDRPGVWHMGNSHTYALPGSTPETPLRTNVSGITIEELAKRVAGHGTEDTQFYLLSYPNFLPFEMLTRVGDVLYHGYRPSVVFLGLTWRNIARDSQPRHVIYTAYRDAEFSAALEKLLADPRVAAAPEILEAIAEQRARVAHDEEQERQRSDSDRIDERLTGWVSRHVSLMGQSAALRAKVYRLLTERIQAKWNDRSGVEYTYDMVESDYSFNWQCLLALVRLLQAHGATVICYWAPERSDLPPLMDPKQQAEFVARFTKEMDSLGVTVLDASGLVPNELWGYVDGSPDRSHFMEPGHQLLAQFLFDEALRRNVWKGLSHP